MTVHKLTLGFDTDYDDSTVLHRTPESVLAYWESEIGHEVRPSKLRIIEPQVACDHFYRYLGTGRYAVRNEELDREVVKEFRVFYCQRCLKIEKVEQ